jgi:hypothetical protein
VDAELLDFYSRFFAQWASTDDFDAMARAFGVPSGMRGKPNSLSAPMSYDELAARLHLWRIRHHGRVACFAHAATPLTARERSEVLAIARTAVRLPGTPRPLTPSFRWWLATGSVPLLGFIVSSLAAAASGNQRAVAITKFRHAPYDTIEVLPLNAPTASGALFRSTPSVDH